ncbi:unnamed protein product [Rotaria sordida]|uniref:Uncharacterized protein n=1 Tax=Rotaria sordida TaxID=392033 RepID=A0A814SDB2_9BILA|nr:unnamed protein product [Rotaria sordida]CAF1145914.1 unnamed protein product [Rotaria sordida]
MILLFILQFYFFLILVQSKFYETDRKNSNDFLKTKISFENTYEQSKEIIETQRESCLDEYQQQHTFYRRHQKLSSSCQQYCTETMDCQQENEQSACINPSWPSRTLKFVKKFRRICYIRITEILRYELAEQLCQRYGLQLAIIDNIPLLEYLKQTNMFNTTCKGPCPETRGYYIGLRRYIDENGSSLSKWIWSNNVTWTQNETDCDDEYSETSFANSTFFCYMGSDGQKKVTVWNTGEPNNHRSNAFQKDEQCVEIIGRPDKTGSYEQIGKLNDISCINPTLGVICQMDDLKPINRTQFKYFAKIIGFNETENEENDLLNNFLLNFKDSFVSNLASMAVMTDALEKLLVLPSFTIEQAHNVLNIFNQLINITEQIEIENYSLKIITNKYRLLHFLDLFTTKIQIDNNEQITSFQYNNMNTSLININFNQWQQDNKDSEWFTITSDHYPNSIVELNMRTLRTQIESIDNYRIIKIVFSNFNLFPQINQTNGNSNQLIGIPISYQIINWTNIRTDNDVVRFQIRIAESIQSRNISCIYWSFDENNGSWIMDNGCRFIGYIDDYAQCSCNHLTHFALLLLPESKQIIESLSTTEQFILTFVTYIGIGLSIFGLIMTLMTYALFRCSQKNRLHASLFMLCLSILFANCIYIPFSLTKQNYVCNIFGFLFHYFLLTSFMWMFIMTFIQYMHFVRILNSYISHFFIKSTIIGWIIPIIFPILVLLLDKNGYVGEFRCWINNKILLYTTFLVPISIIVSCNLIIFIFILKSLCRHDPTILTNQNNRSKLQIGATICCFVSIGCTWLSGILVLIRAIFIHQLIFCICNTLQGFFIFLFHVYLSKPKRDLWQRFFIQHGFHQRSHSFTNRTKPITSTDHITSLTRPIQLHLTPKSSLDKTQEISSGINPIFTDHNGNNSSNKNQIPPNRLSDRIQKTKINMNNNA